MAGADRAQDGRSTAWHQQLLYDVDKVLATGSGTVSVGSDAGRQRINDPNVVATRAYSEHRRSGGGHSGADSATQSGGKPSGSATSGNKDGSKVPGS